MKTFNPRLKIIAEHRGRFSQGCPENSLCSIGATSQEGIEAVEIDVRESADGTLWPIHDTTIGRVTNYSLTGRLFDPYAGRTSENDKNNPQISLMHDGTLQNLKLRDPLGNVSGYRFETLENTIRAADTVNRNLVYIFDIKTPSAITKTASMVNRLSIADRSILKFNASITSPLFVRGQVQGVNFVPVIGTGSLDYIVDHYHLEKSSPSERVNDYVKDFSSVPGFVYFEVRNKMIKGPPSGNSAAGVTVEGPLSQVNFYMDLTKIAIGGFSPSVEHNGAPGQPGTGYYSVDGYCCTLLAANQDRSTYFGNNTRDDRENIHYMIAINEVIISERGSAALAEARAMGARADQARLYY